MELSRRMVMFVGLVGLLTVAFSLQSATVRLKETPVGLLTGLTPLINVELPHSRAELETLLGPPGSENRKIIANRLVFVGFDFVPGWLIFLFGLEILIHNFRPRMRRWEAMMLTVMTATLILEWLVVRQTAVAFFGMDDPSRNTGSAQPFGRTLLPMQPTHVRAQCAHGVLRDVLAEVLLQIALAFGW